MPSTDPPTDPPPPTPRSTDDDAANNSLSITPSFISLAGQLGVGGLCGYSVGYATKEIGKIVLFWGGTAVIGLQILAYKGILTMHWGTLFKSLKGSLKLTEGEEDPNGKDAQLWFQKFVTLVSHGIPGSTSFLGGMYLGLRS